MTQFSYDSVPYDLDMALFLKRTPSSDIEPLFGLDVTMIKTQADVDQNRWVCGHCGRSNSGFAPLCASCGATATQAKVRGCVAIEGWLPWAAVLYSVVDGFTLYITRIACGRFDTYRPEENVYTLQNCTAGPVSAVGVVKGCREEGDCGEIIKLHCDISCECVYTGTPCQKGNGEQ